MEQLGERVGILALILTTVSLDTSSHPFVLILCYLIHELGHILMSRLLGAKMRKLKIGPLHLSLSYDCSSLTYFRELLVQLGGIFFNVISAAFVMLVPFLQGDVYDFFVVGSFSLAAMNLYPITILDGAGALKSVLLMIFSERTAEKASRAVSFACAIVMWLVAVYLQIAFSSNMSLFFISVLLLVELCFTY